MAIVDLLSSFLGVSDKPFTKEEKLIIEADLLVSICLELKEFFRTQYKSRFQLTKLNLEMENKMLDGNYAYLVLKDILSTGEYTLSGIAYYTHTPEDVVYDIATGCNLSPSATFLQHLIVIHQEVRRELYTAIRKKVAEQYVIILDKEIKE